MTEDTHSAGNIWLFTRIAKMKSEHRFMQQILLDLYHADTSTVLDDVFGGINIEKDFGITKEIEDRYFESLEEQT